MTDVHVKTRPSIEGYDGHHFIYREDTDEVMAIVREQGGQWLLHVTPSFNHKERVFFSKEAAFKQVAAAIVPIILSTVPLGSCVFWDIPLLGNYPAPEYATSWPARHA